jgi:hypothetical protein
MPASVQTRAYMRGWTQGHKGSIVSKATEVSWDGKTDVANRVLQNALQALGPTRPTPELKQPRYERDGSATATHSEVEEAAQDPSNPFRTTSVQEE